MNTDFQDKIDEYLLHGDAMSEEDKALFLKEIEEDREKRELFEFTIDVKRAIKSREEKLKAIAEFEKDMQKKRTRRKLLLWWSGIAAMVIVGFFTVKQMNTVSTPDEIIRGGDDIFNVVPADSLTNDSILTDTIGHNGRTK